MKLKLAVAAWAVCLGVNALAGGSAPARAAKDHGIGISAAVQRFQTQADKLQVIEQMVVRTTSRPVPHDRLQIQLPPGARIQAAMLQNGDAPPSSQPVLHAPEEDRYYVPLPLPPGETRLQLIYRLPYTGAAVIKPKFLYPVERFVVVLPQSMSFEASRPGVFQSAPSQGEDTVWVAAPASAAEPLGFRISGAGILADIRARQQAEQRRESARPGGGLGTPVNLPDPLHDYRWRILAALCAALMLGGISVVRRPAARIARLRNAGSAQ